MVPLVLPLPPEVDEAVALGVIVELPLPVEDDPEVSVADAEAEEEDDAGGGAAEEEEEEEGTAALLELLLPPPLKAAQNCSVAGRTLFCATSLPHACSTQGVTSCLISSMCLQTQAKSVVEHDVLPTPARMQEREHGGKTEMSWAEAVAAARARRAVVYFIVDGCVVVYI